MYDQSHDHLPRSVSKDRNGSIDGKKLDIEADEIGGLHSLTKKWDWRELLFYSSTPRSPFLSAKEEGGFLLGM
jgi:hypothetical protein